MNKYNLSLTVQGGRGAGGRGRPTCKQALVMCCEGSGANQRRLPRALS